MALLQEKYDNEYYRAKEHQQHHIFNFYEELKAEEKKQLLQQAASIDYAFIKELYKNAQDKSDIKEEHIKPPQLHIKEETTKNTIKKGEEAIKKGKLAIFIVAGGQGSRLGYEGPKGCYPVTPVTKKPIFQLLAEKIKATQNNYKTTIELYIMTSETNHEATKKYFKENEHFGLEEKHIVFFKQQMLPSVDEEGKILLSDQSTIAMAPGGTGGIYQALHEAKITERMKTQGIEMLHYIQVDNPLVALPDPSFVGTHIESGAEISNKVVEKSYPEERVGVFVEEEEKTKLVEYIHLPEALAYQRDADKKLTYRAGSIANHIINREFIQRIATEHQLPYFLAHKKITHVDEKGEHITPLEPNGYKFESFVFDAIPQAKKTMIMQVQREDEFAPIKNAKGKDSPSSAAHLMIEQAKRWLVAAGIDEEVVQGIEAVEISPLAALTEEDFTSSIKPIIKQMNEKLKGQKNVYLD